MKHLFEKLYLPNRRPRTYETQEELLDAAKGYFEFCAGNPLQSEKLFQYRGEVTREPINHARTMSLKSLLVWLDIRSITWANWTRPGHVDFREDLAGACELLEHVLEDYILTHAAAGLTDSAIAIRQLGLRDDSNVTFDGRIADREMTKEELEAEMDRRGIPRSAFDYMLSVMTGDVGLPPEVDEVDEG